jgi:hypothetical protein
MLKVIRSLINVLIIIDEIILYFSPIGVEDSIFHSNMAKRVRQRLDVLTSIMLYLLVSIVPPLLLFLKCGNPEGVFSFAETLKALSFLVILPLIVVILLAVFLYLAIPFGFVFHIAVKSLDEFFEDQVAKNSLAKNTDVK